MARTPPPPTLADVIAAWRTTSPETAASIERLDPHAARHYLEGVVAERTEHAALYRRMNPARTKATAPAVKLSVAWLRALPRG